MSTKFFNNTPEHSLFDKFKDIAHSMANFHTFQAAQGYFRSSGYFKLREEFANAKKIQILVGINIDNLFRNQARLFIGKLDENTVRKAYSEDFIEEVKNAGYDELTERGILQFCQDICDGKLEMRIHHSKNLHAKFYLLLPDNFGESSDGWVIMGSSNISDQGLGTSQTERYELNVAMKDYDDVNYCKQEFEKLWADAVPLEMSDVQRMKAQTYLDQLPTPYELYMKVLIDTFGAQVEDDFTMEMPEGIRDIRYQRDAVIQGYQMLMQHNGFFLADVVGLGKTIVATMIAKRFIEANGRYTNILVIYPPALEQNWKETFKLFGIKRYAQFVSNGSLNKVINGENNYRDKAEFDLVIVDEAHNFRGDSAARYDDLQVICKAPRANEGRVKGHAKKVMLLSATPLNNRPNDLLNLILLFQNARSSTIENIQNLQSTFSPWIDQYNKKMHERKGFVQKDGETEEQWKKREKEFNEKLAQEIDKLYDEIRTQVLDKITVRRTRNNIKNVPAYKKDLDDQGIKFPEILAPNELVYQLTDGLDDLFYSTMSVLTDTPSTDNPDGKGLHYARYRAVEFLVGEAKEKYPNAAHIASTLMGIYRVHMVKRLESSFYAFRKSLHTLLSITNNMIDMFAKDKVIIAPEIDVKDKQAKGWELDKIIEYALVHGLEKNDIVFHGSDFNEQFLRMLHEDADKIKELCRQWDAVTRDPKLELFVEKIKHELFDKRINPTGKLVIFSESVDTVNYLYEELAKRSGRTDILKVSSVNRDQLQATIRKCFDANSGEQSDDYNIIITSDVLAEGVNLHRANVIINYDSPWNATRLMQRIGRVNRIGSVAGEIYNYLFYPSQQGDSQIHLYSNALIKLQGFHSAFGEDAQIYTKEEIVKEFKLFNPDIVDNVDRSLKLLEEVRQLYQKDRKLYDRIKRLPLKSRTVRTVDDCKKRVSHQSTIVFLSSPRKTEYYWVANGECPKSITFLDAMDIMRAEKDETPKSLSEVMECHYEQVKAAIKSYKESATQQFNGDSMNNLRKDSATVEVLKSLRAMSRALESEEEFSVAAKANELARYVEIGLFNQLRSKIRSFSREQKKQSTNSAETLKQIKDLINNQYDRYHIALDAADDALSTIYEPQIVVSESFI